MITEPVPVSPHDTPKPGRSRQSARSLSPYPRSARLWSTQRRRCTLVRPAPFAHRPFIYRSIPAREAACRNIPMGCFLGGAGTGPCGTLASSAPMRAEQGGIEGTCPRRAAAPPATAARTGRPAPAASRRSSAGRSAPAAARCPAGPRAGTASRRQAQTQATRASAPTGSASYPRPAGRAPGESAASGMFPAVTDARPPDTSPPARPGPPPLSRPMSHARPTA